MSWDGLYQAKRHHATKVGHRLVVTCGRRFARSKTTEATVRAVNCFACLKKLGLIK